MARGVYLHPAYMMRNRLPLLLCIFMQLCFARRIQAQHLRFGVIAGTGLTSDYTTYNSPEQSVSLSDGRLFVFPGYLVKPADRSPIGGPLLEWEFNDRFSIETNAIYRRLRVQSGGPTVTWQFPVLAKFGVPLATNGVRPFLELGPSFRTTGNRNTNPSHAGFTGGAGMARRWRGLRFAPTLRYTRWSADPRSENVRSKQDQLEVLFAVSRDAVSDRKPFGTRASVGVVGGMTLVRPLATAAFGGTSIPGNLFASSTRYLRTWIVGARLQVDLTRELALLGEAN
jgi:hypothetical protein